MNVIEVFTRGTGIVNGLLVFERPVSWKASIDGRSCTNHEANVAAELSKEIVAHRRQHRARCSSWRASSLTGISAPPRHESNAWRIESEMAITVAAVAHASKSSHAAKSTGVLGAPNLSQQGPTYGQRGTQPMPQSEQSVPGKHDP